MEKTSVIEGILNPLPKTLATISTNQ